MAFPLNDSVIRHSASLHWLPRAAVRQLPRYYQSAPTSHRPSRIALFRSLSGTTDCRSSRGGGELPLAGSSSVLTPVPQSSAFDAHSWRRWDLPGSSATPLRTCPALRPRRTGHVRPVKTYPMLPSAQLTASAPRSVTFRGSITQPARLLSTLRGSDCSDRHRARLATQWRPTLLGQDSHPLGCIRRFPRCVFNSHRFPLLEAFLAHQPACRRHAGDEVGSSAAGAEAGPHQLQRGYRPGT